MTHNSQLLVFRPFFSKEWENLTKGYRDRKLKRIESSERVKYILNATRGKFDYDLLSLLTVDDVQEKVQYHS
jgi:pyruvate-formate lyase-activating enzyme